MVHWCCFLLIQVWKFFIFCLKGVNVLIKTCTCCRGSYGMCLVAKSEVRIAWLISSGFFCFVPHHFLIEYLSVGIQQSIRKVQLLYRILSRCTWKRPKSKPKLDGTALLQSWIDNTSCTLLHLNPTFVSLSNCFVSLHLQKGNMPDIMVDNFNGLQQDFKMLILECFESVLINAICAQCRDTTNYELDSRCDWEVNQH